MIKFLNKLGEFVYRYRWAILLIWVVMIGVGASFGSKLPDLLTGGGWNVSGSDSDKAKNYIIENFEGRSASSLTLVIQDSENMVGDEKYSEKLEAVTENLLKEEEIESIYTWLNAPEPIKGALVGQDKHTSIGFVEMNIDEGFALKILPQIQEELSDKGKELGIDATLLGTPALWGEVNALSKEGLSKAHLYTIPIVLLILLWVFRSLMSAVAPLIVAVSSLLVTFGLLYFIAKQTELSVFVQDASTMIGLGVGIDFSLILVMRFRDELVRLNNNIQEAIKKTMETSGHAIIFSSLTIMGAMSALFIVDIAAIRSIALGVISVVFVLLLVSTTLLPAILSLLGPKINKGKIPLLSSDSGSKLWYKWSHVIMRRPVVFFFLSLIILIALSLPSLDFKTSTPDVRMLPEQSSVRNGVEILEEEFGPGFTSPIQIVIHSPKESFGATEHLKFIDELSMKVLKLKNVKSVTAASSLLGELDINAKAELIKNKEELDEGFKTILSRYINPTNDTAIIEVISNNFSSSDETRALVKSIRKDIISNLPSNNYSITVGGETAEGIDSDKVLTDNLIPVILITLVLIYLILLFTFKSVILPLKAILLNLLSLGATYGVLIAVFQFGWGSDILGFGDVGFIQNFIPLLLLGLLFSLSTDYEVFLLSRVKEEYNINQNNEESVAVGLEKTAPMISGAALLMIAVFSSFALAGVLPMQQLGFGMAIAILIDATLIRLVVVPATMKMMGKWNWWFPGTKKQVQKRQHRKSV